MTLFLSPYAARADEVRFALVIGNSQYKTGALATPANDAGLVADALTAAGFTVTGARDLDQATLRQTFQEFLNQVASAGPDAVALVYLAGYGLQFEGENYFVPIDADIQRDVDVPLQAIRVSDFMQPLAAMPGRVKIVILDAARQNPFARGGEPLAGGLALVDPPPSMAIAFNAAPGTVGPQEPGPYGAYATALTEMIGAGGLALDDIFTRVRLRVSEQTQGAEVPWYASQLGEPFFLTERAADAPPPPNALPLTDIRNRPMQDFGNPDDAYAAAIALDTIAGYQQFLTLYPNSPYAQRIGVMLAVRREEIAWRRCVSADTPPAYWSYLRRYPRGPHAWDARRRLDMLRAALEPPPDFAVFDLGVPPPPPDELVYLDQPIIIFAGPRFRPPPPPPPFFLPPRPREFARLPPPPPPHERFALPVPAAAAIVPAFIHPPRTVRPAPAGAGPGGRPETRVSLPSAITHAPPATPGARPGFGTPAAPAPARPGAVAPPPAPPSAAVRPAPPPPHPGTAPERPAADHPAAVPEHPAAAPEHPAAAPEHRPAGVPEHPAVTPEHPAHPPEAAPAVKPPTPPAPTPHPAAPPPRPTPAPAVKPPPAPPHPAPAPAKPPPPPPHPAPPPPAPHPAPAAAPAKPSPPPAKPACPPGKTETPSGCK